MSGRRLTFLPWLIDFVKLKMSRVMVARSPAAERNKQPILEVLLQHIKQDEKYNALEIASGTGQHVVHFAPHFPNVVWQPTEYDQESMESTCGYVAALNSKSVKLPLSVDAAAPVSEWGKGEFQPKSFDIILNINMIHIAPWNAAMGLFRGAGVLLKSEGLLFTYGPYKFHGVLTPESNVNFDRNLRARCNQWGVRDVDDLEILAKENGLSLIKTIGMPANNHTLIFKKD
ncbi:methyltransferase-like 26 [Tubulanus polymorphus]|uniref:methyltransferase-like 26 n=1 Tax=Tubulanus polymorphus TaxID=672921 RepID=UPI003DA285F2